MSYTLTEMDLVRAALLDAQYSGLCIHEVNALAENAATIPDLLDAIGLYTMGDIDVTHFAPMVVKL